MERRYDVSPADEGTVLRRFAVLTSDRVAAFCFLDYAEGGPDPRLIAFEDQFRAEFGHHLWPLGVDLATHSAEQEYPDQPRMDCPYVAGGCYYSGTTSGAMRLTAEWERQGRDDEFIFKFLENMASGG